jgi:hypothetical protein
MKYSSNERGMVPILVIVLVVVLVAAAGVAVYNVQKSRQKVAQTVNSSPSPSSSSSNASPAATATPTPTPAPTDQQLITEALKAYFASHGSTPAHGSQLILHKLEGNYALARLAVNSGAGGGMILVKKNQGAWSVVWEGQNGLDTAIKQYGFPQSFNTYGSAGSTVLYTY